MNPYVTRDASGTRLNTKYLMDKQRGGGSKKQRKDKGVVRVLKKGNVVRRRIDNLFY